MKVWTGPALRVLVFVALSACGGGAPEDGEEAGAELSRAGATASTSLQRVTMTVPTMSCPLCAKPIEKRLEEAGLHGIEIDLENKLVTARFDPGRTTVEEIRGLVEGQGYPVAEARVTDR